MSKTILTEYHRLVAALKEEFEVEPEIATRAINVYKRIIFGNQKYPVFLKNVHLLQFHILNAFNLPPGGLKEDDTELLVKQLFVFEAKRIFADAVTWIALAQVNGTSNDYHAEKDYSEWQRKIKTGHKKAMTIENTWLKYCIEHFASETQA